jgi:hypothetical protein
MDPALLATSTALALVLGLVLGLALTAPARRRVERDLRTVRADLARVTERVDDLVRRSGHRSPAVPERPEPDYVITSLPGDERAAGPRPGEPGDEDPATSHLTSRRDFASVALAESALRVASLAYGVRRALSPASRSRIRFEMAQEVKRARRQRRRVAKQARHQQRVGPADAAGHSAAPGSRDAEDAA